MEVRPLHSGRIYTFYLGVAAEMTAKSSQDLGSLVPRREEGDGNERTVQGIIIFVVVSLPPTHRIPLSADLAKFSGAHSLDCQDSMGG